MGRCVRCVRRDDNRDWIGSIHHVRADSRHADLLLTHNSLIVIRSALNLV